MYCKEQRQKQEKISFNMEAACLLFMTEKCSIPGSA